MKILWFTITPCGASEKLGLNINLNGWLYSMEKQLVLNKNIELYISFYWGRKLEPFLLNRTVYYPVLRTHSGSRRGRLFKRVLHRIDDKTEVKQLLKVIEAVKPDIIHIHGTEENFGLIQRYTNIPLVISIQGIISPYQNKYFSGIPLLDAFWHEGLIPKLLFKSVHYNYNNLKRAAERERSIFSQTSFIIGRTDWDRRITQILSPTSHYYIGNEILRSTFYEKLWNKKKFTNPLQLVTTMSGGLYKGLEAIAMAARILIQNKKTDFTWTVIGIRESDSIAKIVKSWLKVDFKAIKINLVGGKKDNELVEILLESDIYCQVSHIENSPNSLCEAMLLGMPIIASFAGGTDSILENRKEGVLIQDGDPYSLAGAIIEMTQNIQTAIEYGLAAHTKAIMRHNKSNITNNLIDTYKEIIFIK